MSRSLFAFLLAALSGILLVLAYPPFGAAWLIWIALIPALLGVHLDAGSVKLPLRPSRANWPVWAPGYLLGLISFGGIFWWVGLVTVAGALFLVLYLALYPTLWLVYAARRWPRTPPYTSGGILLVGVELASVWVLLEWVRGWLFTGLGWNGLGVALYQNLPLVQGVRLGGVLFLSWGVALANVVGALTLVRFTHEARGHQKLRAHLDFSVVMLGIAILFVTGWHQIWKVRPGEARQIRYALIQPNIPQLLDESFPPEESLRRHIDLTEKAALLHPDLVVWPESPVGIDLVLDRPSHEALFNLLDTHDFSLLAGSLHIVEGKVFNSALLFAPHNSALHVYDKNHLLPFGEYAPFANWLPIMRRLVPFSIDFSPGDRPRLLTLENGVRLLPLICYEDTLSGYARKGARLDPDLLVNITNDAWFGSSPAAAQHLANAVFRAVELDRPLLRCGNNGISAVIEPTGRILSELKVEDRNTDIAGILTGELSWHPAEETFYARHGNWIVALSALIVGWRLLRAREALSKRSAIPEST